MSERLPNLWWIAVILIVVIAAGAALRFVGTDWDDGSHLHPDERFLTMVQGAMSIPDNPSDYFATDISTLNPRNVGYGFFVYGTWPMTVVRMVAEGLATVMGYPPPMDEVEGLRSYVPRWLYGGNGYGEVYLVGRAISALLDLGAVILLFLVGALMYDRRVGLLAAVFGAFAAFQIQQSHFFTVDTATNFFVMLFFLGAVPMVHRRGRARWLGTMVAGVGMGLALASKIAVWMLVPVAIVALVALAWRRRGEEPHVWLRVAGQVVLLGVVSFVCLRVGQPDMFAGSGWAQVATDPARYSEITAKLPGDHWWYVLEGVTPDPVKPLLLPDPRWLSNLEEVRGQVTGYGMDWPPNHQWFGRTAYVFPWTNMVLWGMGLALGLTAWIAWAGAGVQLVRGRLKHILPWLWVAVVFLYQGGQWVKTMRYFLVIYPLLMLLAAWGLVALWDGAGRLRSADPSTLSRWQQRLRPYARGLAGGAIGLVVVFTILWGVSMGRIYTRDQSRVAGSRWMYHNVPTAFGLTVVDGQGPGEYMPANHPDNITYDRHSYSLEPGSRLEAMRVLVPGDDAVVIDGAHVAYATAPSLGAAPVTVRARLTTDRFPDLDGASDSFLTDGQTTIQLDPTDPQHIKVPFPDTTLEPGGEYYLWIDTSGGPMAGRMAILSNESRWDDGIPLGIDGYAGFDDGNTSYGEGLYGSSQLEMFDEDFPDKVERTVAALEGADYIVSTSNRVYDSIDQIPSRYPMTMRYYEMLFDGDLGFERVADIHSYPGIGPIEFNDQSAEEAWHVYDHPRVQLFAKTDAFDADEVRGELMAAVGLRDWVWPSTPDSIVGAIRSKLPALGGDEGSTGMVESPSPDRLMLSPERRAEQRTSGTWSSLFTMTGIVNRNPALATVVWYLAVLALGIVAFPLLFVSLDNLADRGWALARIAGLLLVSYSAWLVSSLGLLVHTPALVWAMTIALAAIGGAVAWRRRREIRAWVRQHWRLIFAEEVLFLGLFALFLLIRIGNPDLWHPYYGGEKPMDLAYLNATIRTASFPPYDPWFAGGQMNYYYYGFVLVGALIELTGIAPHLAYNLAIPALAAMTGLGVAGLAYGWARAMRRSPRTAGLAGLLAAVLAVIAGNLYQLKFMAEKLAGASDSTFRSYLPGVEIVVRTLDGLAAVLAGNAPWLFDRLAAAAGGVGLEGLASALSYKTEMSVNPSHWYWNASRAIPTPPGDVQPITEFPFFTFLYADLHAHMMALPITVLAFGVALSWALPVGGSWLRDLWRPGRLFALLLGALAVGALWPANTWDYPTYGLVAAGAIAVAFWRRFGRPSWSWVWMVGLQGAALLALSFALFWPHHAAYVQPYADFSMWRSARTDLSAYFVVHGVFLFALLSWALVTLWRDLADASRRMGIVRLLVGTGFLFGGLFTILWMWSHGVAGPASAAPPSPWTPAFAALVLTIGTTLLLRTSASSSERFMAWLLVLGTALTMFVEYVVLSGDIGRMNTVFKFYIQVWVLWSVLAGVSLAVLLPLVRNGTWGRIWQAVLAVLVAAALLYPVTATPAKIRDRFPAMGPMEHEERMAYEAQVGPGLSGITFHDYAVYDDDGYYLTLSHDSDAFRWLQDNVSGTPTILEGFREKGYRWGARYAINTGLPTVVGWDWHQKQQRAGVGGQVVDERTSHVREIYNTTDANRAWALMSDYGVEYVIVGEMERAIYDATGLGKFEDFVANGRAEQVYENPGVTIYRLVRGEAGEPGEAGEERDG